jgi:elongation factor P
MAGFPAHNFLPGKIVSRFSLLFVTLHGMTALALASRWSSKTNIFGQLRGKRKNMGTTIPIQKISNGMKLEHKNDVWNIVEFAHVKPGKGGAFVRMKLKSMTTGRVLEETMQASAKVEQANVSYRKMSYLYADGDDYIFMDAESFEQAPVSKEAIGDNANFLLENMEVSIIFWDDSILSIEMPTKVDLKVVETLGAVRGDTATNVTKDATLETGYVAQVPLFIKAGDVVRIDTRDGAYETRVSN